jgi:hypothetical protein
MKDAAFWGFLLGLLILPNSCSSRGQKLTSSQKDSVSEAPHASPGQVANPDPKDAVLVEQFFPERLTAESQKDFQQGGPEPSRFSAFVAADLNNTGKEDFLVAAYTNGFSAAVRVLKKQGGAATVVAEPALPLMAGVMAQVSLARLDSAPVPEIVVNFSSGAGGSSDWIFKWTGAELKVFGPTETDTNGNVFTVLNDAAFEDLTGDGIPEILDPPERLSSAPMKVYQLVDGRYELTSLRIYALDWFGRGPDAPEVQTREFSLDDPAKDYVLVIANGGGDNTNFVNSGEIKWNGDVVAGPDHLNQRTRSLRIPVKVTGSKNTATVELHGDPGSRILMGVATP